MRSAWWYLVRAPDLVFTDYFAPAGHLGEQKLLQCIWAAGDKIHPQLITELAANLGLTKEINESMVKFFAHRGGYAGWPEYSAPGEHRKTFKALLCQGRNVG